MTARVYAFDPKEEEALKKLLAYDPYLDKNLIPSMPSEWSNKEYLEKHPEVKAQAEELAKKAEEALAKLKSDKEANVIFARQDYAIKTGGELGLDPAMQYLYLDMPDEDWDIAEKKLKKAVASIKRLNAEDEAKAINVVAEERQRSDQGLGFIFG